MWSCEVKFDRGKWSTSVGCSGRRVRVQRVYLRQKINLVGTLLTVLAFEITGEMAVNLIGCLITGAGILPAEGRFLVSHTVRTAILIGLLRGFRHSHPTVCRPLRCCDGEFELAILNVVTSNHFLVCQSCGLATFWGEFCEGNYDDSRGRISVAIVRRRE